MPESDAWMCGRGRVPESDAWSVEEEGGRKAKIGVLKRKGDGKQGLECGRRNVPESQAWRIELALTKRFYKAKYIDKKT